MEPTQFKLALLQAYPLGTLEVHDARNNERSLLLGLSAHGRFAYCQYFDKRDPTKQQADVLLAQLTPVLHPFRSLTTKLADGTVPAVEVAKMIKLLRENDKVTLCEYFPDHHRCGNCIQIERAHDWSVRITEADWNGLVWRGVAIDYLRRNLYALPIGGQPLQEGTDYIAKED